jgi:hypothetical protein
MIFDEKPWFSNPVAGQFLPQPVGMLGDYEASLYYYLARDFYTGKGVIID